jgi:hypothetical protein
MLPSALTESPVRTGLLRYISPTNSIPTLLETMSSTETDLAAKEVHYIGSGDVDGIRALNFGWAHGTTGVQICPAYTIVEAWLVRVATNQAVPFKWAGATSRAVASGESQVISDQITPSQFGLSTFARGDKFITAFHLTCGAGGKFPATAIRAGTQLPSGSVMAYDPATSTITNLASTATLGVSGLPRSSRPGFSPVLLGTFVSGDPIVCMGIGDSIVADVGATSRAGDAGGSFFARSLWPTDKVIANPFAGFNAGLPGGVPSAWLTATNGSQAKLNALLQYANRFVEEYGINDISYPAMLDNSKGIWAAIKANAPQSGGRAVKIARTSLWVRENGAGQPDTGYGPTGNIPTFNAACAALAGASDGPDVYIDCRDPVVLSTTPGTVDNYRWGVGMGDGGAHPSETGHTLIAADGVRDWMLS